MHLLDVGEEIGVPETWGSEVPRVPRGSRGSEVANVPNLPNFALEPLACQSPGSVIFFASTHSSNCSAVSRPSASAASFSVVPSLCAFFAIFAALS